MLAHMSPGISSIHTSRRQRYFYTATVLLIFYTVLFEYRYGHRNYRLPGSYDPASTDLATVNPVIEPFEIEGPHEIWPLQRVCNETVFTPGLIFICDNNSGGIGNMRNFILTCIRYGIAAGASGFTIPHLQKRDGENLGHLFTGSQPFSYFFDEEYFRNSMDKACPQIRLYGNYSEIEDYGEIRHVADAHFKTMDGLVINDGVLDDRGPNRHLVTFRRDFDMWLKGVKNTIPSPHKPVGITLRWALFFEWDVARDGQEFANTFGRILKIRPDVVELAKNVMNELAVYAGTTEAHDKTKEGEDGLPTVDYLGVHLRTEADALDFWPTYQDQSNGFLKVNSEPGLRHKYAYLASGSADESKRFTAQAWDMQSLNVTSKYHLLKDEDLKQLKELHWDQQALVDYLVLLKSTHFVGCSFSTFAHNVALRRHLLIEGYHSRPFLMPTDGLSTLVGRFDQYYSDWMWMQDTMWP